MAKSLFNNDETEENSRTPENIDTPKSDTTSSTPTPPSSFFRRMSPSLIMTTASLL
eukprot:gene7152-9530_t